MPVDASQIVVGANGSVHVAPVGTAMPATVAATLDPAFVDLGYLNENGASISDAKTLQNIDVWQSFYPARRIITGRDFTVAFALAQWNADTVPLAFGGGTITEPDPTAAPGEYQFVPPAPGEIDTRALVLTWQDGDNDYRLLIPTGMVTDTVDTNVQRSNNAELPITFSVNGSDADDPYLLLTNDPAFAP